MQHGGPVDLVFEGGGIKGIALVGALSVLEEHGYVARRRAGASAGAIVAALHAAGYSASELLGILMDFDFTAFLDEGWEDRIPILGKPLSVLFDLGVCEGDAFAEWIAERLAERGVVTFGDLRSEEQREDARFNWKLQVVVSDVSKHEMVLLPLQAHQKFGCEPDELRVADAVRASMSIPVVFEPWRMKCDLPDDKEDHLLVDGGMLSNFPLWVFDTDEHRWPSFGLRLMDGKPSNPIGKQLADLGMFDPKRYRSVRYGMALLQTMIEAHDRAYIEQEDFARTIPIETLGVGTLQFDLPREQKLELYDSGRRAAEEFLGEFEFEAWKNTFGRHKKRTRGDAVRMQMREFGTPRADAAGRAFAEE